MVRRRTVVCACLGAVVATTPGGAATSEPDLLSTAPRDRAQALALPAVWRVEARVDVPALRTRDGRTFSLPPAGRTVTVTGTAVAVSPRGVLVTAAHVAAPVGETLALPAAAVALAARGRYHSPGYLRQWVRRQAARPMGARVRVLRVWPAIPAGAPASRPAPARVVPGGVDRPGDLAVLRVAARGIPSLLLDDSATRGTPVATLGFGTTGARADVAGAPAVPVIRWGTLGDSFMERRFGRQPLLKVATPVEVGDSGGPAVDAHGRVHGIVRLRRVDPARAIHIGILEPSPRVRALLARVGVVNVAGPSADAFAEGLRRLEVVDADGARQAFSRSLEDYPGHALAGRGYEQALALGRAGYAVEANDGRRPLLLGIALLCGIGSLFCVAALRRGTGNGHGSDARAARQSRSRLLD